MANMLMWKLVMGIEGRESARILYHSMRPDAFVDHSIRRHMTLPASLSMSSDCNNR